MGQTLSEPVTTKESLSCEDASFKVGSSSMQGWRVSMEDAHVHLLSVPEDKNAAFFAVYDGHGGPNVAKCAETNLHKYILQRPAYANNDIVTAFREGFLEFDYAMQCEDKLKNSGAGTTANTLLIKGDQLYCGNVGDSRAVACIKGVCHPLSFDHKPTNPSEQARIRAAGGFVEFNRVNGNLALSRALGDFAFKRNSTKTPEQQMVTAFPDVEVRTITEDWEFIVMACDGIWDVVSNEEAVEFIRCPLAAGLEPDKICEQLMSACLAPDCQMGGLGCDNMTIILICFLHGQPWLKYCSKIAETLDTALLGFTKGLSTFSRAESSDDDDDVIPDENLNQAKSISASLATTLQKSKDVYVSVEQAGSDEPMDTHVFQNVLLAGDYVHKGKGDIVLKQTKSSSATVQEFLVAEPGITDTENSSFPSMNDLTSVLQEEVLDNIPEVEQPTSSSSPNSSSRPTTRRTHNASSSVNVDRIASNFYQVLVMVVVTNCA